MDSFTIGILNLFRVQKYITHGFIYNWDFKSIWSAEVHRFIFIQSSNALGEIRKEHFNFSKGVFECTHNYNLFFRNCFFQEKPKFDKYSITTVLQYICSFYSIFFLSFFGF